MYSALVRMESKERVIGNMGSIEYKSNNLVLMTLAKYLHETLPEIESFLDSPAFVFHEQTQRFLLIAYAQNCWIFRQ